MIRRCTQKYFSCCWHSTGSLKTACSDKRSCRNNRRLSSNSPFTYFQPKVLCRRRTQQEGPTTFHKLFLLWCFLTLPLIKAYECSRYQQHDSSWRSLSKLLTLPGKQGLHPHCLNALVLELPPLTVALSWSSETYAKGSLSPLWLLTPTTADTKQKGLEGQRISSRTPNLLTTLACDQCPAKDSTNCMKFPSSSKVKKVPSWM